jgi:hypothetical protein
LSFGDRRDHQNPECLNQNGKWNLKLRGHEVDAGHCGKPKGPAGDLHRQEFLGDKPKGENRSENLARKPAIPEREKYGAKQIREEGAVEQLINENLGDDNGPIVSHPEPRILATVEKIDCHTHQTDERARQSEVPEIFPARLPTLKKNNSHQLRQERP